MFKLCHSKETGLPACFSWRHNWLPPRQQLLHHLLLAWMATWQRSRKLCWIILEEPGLFEIVSNLGAKFHLMSYHHVPCFPTKIGHRMDYHPTIIQHFVCQLWMTRLMRHVSFNRWLVRYLYVPLGGRKCPGFPGFQHQVAEAQVSSGCSWPLLIVDIMVYSWSLSIIYHGISPLSLLIVN